MKKRHWTLEEINKLIELNKNGLLNIQLASFFERSPSAIQYKLQRLNLRSNRPNRFDGWTEDEINILQNNKHLTIKELSRLLSNRTKDAIRNKLDKSNLIYKKKKKSTEITEKELNEIRHLRKQNKGIVEISKILHREHTFISSICKKYKFYKKNTWDAEVNDTILIKKNNEGKSIREIAKLLAVTRPVISRRLKELNLSCAYTADRNYYINFKKQEIYQNIPIEVKNVLCARHRSAKTRCKSKNMIFDITLDFLVKLFIKQCGKCYYSGIKMEYTSNSRNAYNCSLDRIDSSKGYTNDNLVLCCDIVNVMKSNMPIIQFKLFINSIYKNLNIEKDNFFTL